MAGIGHGTPTPINANEALAIAAASTPASDAQVDATARPAMTAGTPVTVTPDDYGAVPVAGELMGLTQYDVSLKRSDPKTGDVVVHFPRIGYRVEPA